MSDNNGEIDRDAMDDTFDDTKLTDEQMQEVQDYDRNLNLHFTSAMDSLLQKTKSAELQRLRQEERDAETARLKGLQGEQNIERQEEQQEAREKAQEYWNSLDRKIDELLRTEARAYDSFETGMMKLFLMADEFGRALKSDLKALGFYQGINDVVGGILKSPYTVPAYLGSKLRERKEDAADASPKLTAEDRYETMESISSRLKVDDQGKLTIDKFTPKDGEPQGFVTHSDGSKEEMTMSQMADAMLESGIKGLLHKNGWVEMPGESHHWVRKDDVDVKLTEAELNKMVKKDEWKHADIKAFSESFQKEMKMKPPEPVNDKTNDLDNEEGIELSSFSPS